MSPAEAEKKAREIAHPFAYRCSGDSFFSDRRKQHTAACDALTETFSAALLQAVEAEREACAEIIKALAAKRDRNDFYENMEAESLDEAEALIRARGKNND